MTDDFPDKVRAALATVIDHEQWLAGTGLEVTELERDYVVLREAAQRYLQLLRWRECGQRIS